MAKSNSEEIKKKISLTYYNVKSQFAIRFGFWIFISIYFLLFIREHISTFYDIKSEQSRATIKLKWSSILAMALRIIDKLKKMK